MWQVWEHILVNPRESSIHNFQLFEEKQKVQFLAKNKDKEIGLKYSLYDINLPLIRIYPFKL